jgi:hypothetical protein
VRARHRIFLFAICIICFLLPCLAGQAGEKAGACPKPFIKPIFPSAGKPGDLVIIQGKRFGTPPGEVLFTGEFSSPLDLIVGPHAKAEILGWTFHRISVIVPQSAASGPVFVKVHCGEKSNKREYTVKK